MFDDYKYLGDFSATPPEHSRHMSCHDCKVSWTGCWDNFMCPKCGAGELPNSDAPEFDKSMKWKFVERPDSTN